jgi:hypothetical protein
MKNWPYQIGNNKSLTAGKADYGSVYIDSTMDIVFQVPNLENRFTSIKYGFLNLFPGH